MKHVHIHLHTPLQHGWLKYFIKDFETNPRLQYRINMTFTYVWLVNMPVAVSVFLFLPRVWQAASVLYLVIISLYANFATNYGAVSAALAAKFGEVAVEIQPEAEILGRTSSAADEQHHDG